MGIKIYESQGTVQYPRDGALLNYQIFSGQNGALSGCLLANSQTDITITEGTMLVRGYRIRFEGVNVLLPSTTFATLGEGKYKLILAVTASDTDSSYAIKVREYNAYTVQEPIESSSGEYEYIMCSFIIDQGKITEMSSYIKDIVVGGSSSDNMVSLSVFNVPPPRLSVFTGHELEKGLYNGLLILENADEYRRYKQEGYSVVFELYRYQQNAVYNYHKSNLRGRYNRTGYIRSKELGWQNNRTTLDFKLEELISERVATPAGDMYRVGNIIRPMKRYVHQVFYQHTRDDGPREFSITTNSSTIRATRSKACGQLTATPWFKHNHFIFAYTAKLILDGVVVAESQLGNDVAIRVNKGVTSEAPMSAKFRIELK